MNEWTRLWWWSPDTPIEIESGPERWRVNPARVREWRHQNTKQRPPNAPARGFEGVSFVETFDP